MNSELRHCWQVVIMRPTHQAQSLADVVKASGATPHLLPLMEIQPLQLTPAQLSDGLIAVKQGSLLIATSTNAVFCAPKEILEACCVQKMPIVTMGKATTQALNESGCQVFFTAPRGSTSESLLQQPFLSEDKIRKQTILLLAAEDGRTVLAKGLQDKGANVIWLKTYRTQHSKIDVAKALQPWQGKGRYCFVATSHRMLEILLFLSPLEYVSWLKDCPLIVVSERIALHAKEYGFQHIFVSKSAHAEDIVRALQAMAQVCTMV